MVDAPEKISETFDKYFAEFSDVSTQALNVKASDVATLPDVAVTAATVVPAAKESQVLAEQIKSVTAEVVKTKNPIQKLKDNIVKAEAVTLDFLTQGRGAQTKQALQLTGSFKLREFGQNALSGTAGALRGGYGALQGAENAALGLTPFGVGFGAKKVIQAGAGFAALNAVAPAAGQIVLTAGSTLGSTVGGGIGEAFTQYMISHTPGFIAPIVQALGGGISSMLGGVGGSVGTGAALLGAGATTVAASERLVGGGFNAIAPQPLQLALKEAKQAELVGIELSQKITQSVLKGAAQNVQAYIAPAQSVGAEISPITRAFQATQGAQYAALPPAREQFLSVTPRPRIGTNPTGLSAGGAVEQARNIVIASQEARGAFLKLVSDPAIKSGRIDLLYNATVEAQRLIQRAQQAKDQLRQLAYENKGTPAQQQITGNMAPIVKNAKDAQTLLRELVKGYEKSGRDIGVFIQAGIASGLTPTESAAAAEKLVAVIQQTIEAGFEIASPSKWARRAGQFVVQGLSLGLNAKDAITAANNLADGVVAATESGFGSRFKGIGNQFVLGLQDEIVQAQNKLTGGRRFFIKPFEGADNAVKFGADTTIAQIRESGKRIGVEIEKTSSQYELAGNGFRKKLSTPFTGADNAVPFNPNTKIKQILDQAKAQGIEYERTIQKFELSGRGVGQTPSVQAKRFTQFQGNDNRISFNSESRIGDVVRKAQAQGLYADGIEQPKYEIRGAGVQRKTFTETGYKYEPIQQDLDQNLSKVRKSKEQIQQEAFATGRGYGEQFGAGLKGAGKFVESEAKKVGDRIPEGIKSGTGAGIEGIKGFVSGIRDQFSLARKEIPTLDLLAKGIKNIALLAGGGFVGFQAFQVLTSQAKESYAAIKELQSLKINLNISTGNADASLERTRKFSKDLGLDFRETAKASALFFGSVKGTSIEKDAPRIFQDLSKSFAALQLSSELQGRAFQQVQQIATKPKVETEDLKTIAETGLPVFPIARKAFGEDFTAKLQTGQIDSGVFLKKFSEQSAKETASGLDAASKSAQAAENRFKSLAYELQTDFGETAVPLITKGIDVLSSGLQFVKDNAGLLNTVLQVGLVVTLGKLSSIIAGSVAEFAAYNGGLLAIGKSVSGVIASINLPALVGFAAQTLLITAAISALGAAYGAFNGGEGAKFARQIEDQTTKLRALREEEAKVRSQRGTPRPVVTDNFGLAGQDAQNAVGSLLKLDLSGFADSITRVNQNAKAGVFGGDNANSQFGKNAGNIFGLEIGGVGEFLRKSILPLNLIDPTANRKQIDNQQLAIAAGDSQGELSNVFAKGSSFAAQIKKGIVPPPDEIDKTKESIDAIINTYSSLSKEQLALIPGGAATLEQFKKLSAQLEITSPKGLNLANAFKGLTLATRELELSTAKFNATSAERRGQGISTDFAEQSASIKNTRDELEKFLPAQDAVVKALREYVGSKAFKDDAEHGRVNETEQLAKLAEAEKALYGKRQEYAETFTKDRELQYNRRAELLQREITAQESFRAKLEALTRFNTSGAQLGISQRQASRTISPFQTQIEQSAIAQTESADKVAQLNQKLIDQRKGTNQALRNLQQVNPVDEQAYQAAKTQYEGLRNAAIQTQAEINDARKQGFDAVAQTIQAYEEQIRTQIDLTTRKAEQGITAQQQATERLGSAQKRQIEDSVAGLQRQQKFLDLAASAIDRAAKLSGKRSELNTAVNQGAQIPLNGTIAAIRDAEGLIQRLKQKDLDPGVRGRTVGVLNQLGISNNEQDAFRYRIREEEKLARLKAEGISAEIQQSQITLDFEQRREEFASKRAVLAAQETVEAAKRSAIETEIERRKAENEVRRSQIGIAKASAQLDLAQQSGDPNKVKEAQLNLQDAQLTAAGAQDTLIGARQTEKLAKDALPNATLSVVDALANFAATIEGGKLSRRILGAQNQNKAAQFGQEERGRVRGLAIEGIDKGVSVDINNGGALGLDPFGFRASRAKDAAINAADRQRFQNNIKGIPNRTVLPAVAPSAEPVDVSKAFGSDASSAVDASIKAIGAAINFNPVTDKLAALIEIESRLSAQILSLAGRDQVKITNQSYYGQERSVLRGTTL